MDIGAFRDYIAGTFRRAGLSDADARAEKVMALETEIARRHWTTAEMRDVVRLNRVMTPEQLNSWAPGFDWDARPIDNLALRPNAKLDKVVRHIGYPERWRDRSSVLVRPADLFGNQKRMLDWVRADGLKQLAEGTRDGELPCKPQEIDAGCIESLNSITLPAGILQPPCFDPAADPAVNSGAMVAVIGHEFGHGFDDQRSRSNGDGKLRDWWTAKSRAEFETAMSRAVIPAGQATGTDGRLTASPFCESTFDDRASPSHRVYRTVFHQEAETE